MKTFSTKYLGSEVATGYFHYAVQPPGAKQSFIGPGSCRYRMYKVIQVVVKGNLLPQAISVYEIGRVRKKKEGG